ncbi:MAG: hypothetical protein JNL82_11745 [Myxococcales bacterium]|nr:hypothetical protein [Myxococcales bacterium]
MNHLALAAAWLVSSSVTAARPTAGGPWSFDPEDQLATHDLGDALRVHYSVAGPNATRLADADADGAPDYVALVAATTAEALARFRDDLGLRPPLTEAEVELELGGSPALDIYLVDFAGNADGLFGVDACTLAPVRCAGYLVIENDFAGYAYASTAEAVDTVASHEGFHAVQAAYAADLPLYFSEGTATWAERQLRPDSRDFLRLCDGYLADTGRSIFKPPAGPVPAFAYGSALWWDFLTRRHDPALIDAMLSAADEREPLETLTDELTARDDSLAAAWLEFTAANLATGPRANPELGHPYAESLIGITAEQSGAALDDDERFYPLSSRYYLIDHPGGDLWFALAAAAPGLELALHQVDDGAADGPVSAALLAWRGDEAGARSLGDLPPGGYWLSVANPSLADEVLRAHLCTAAEREALTCVEPLAADSEGDTSEGDTGTTDSTDAAAADTDPTATDPEMDGAAGCSSCRTTPTSPPLVLLLGALVRRRKHPAKQPGRAASGQSADMTRRAGHIEPSADMAATNSDPHKIPAPADPTR